MTLDFSYVDETDSTNTQLKNAAMRGAPEGTVLSAGRQTAGRGRSGHDWESPKGDSLSTSLLLYPDAVPAERVPLLTPLAAMAVCEAVEELYGIPTQIKWVNDVLLFEKKVCGILTERILTEGQRQAVVIGIGVNVHQREFPPELAGIATSIDLARQKTGGALDRSKGAPGRKALCEAVWQKFLTYYGRFAKEKDLGYIKEDYNSRLANRSRACRVLDPNGAYEGTALGIDDFGRLLIEPADGGEIRRVDAGEVSVRGLYGYV